MGNKSLLELIKQYWYLGILFVILIVVLVIGTNQEKPWSESLAITETTSSTAEEVESAIVESEVSSTISEDKDNVFRKETTLFFLSDHQPEIEEMEEFVESEPEEVEDSSVEVESIEPTESNSYTPTYSDDTYSKPKSSSSSSTNSSPKPTTPKEPVKDLVPETDESESVHESNPEPVETPEPDPEPSEDSSSAPEIIDSETPAEEISSIDSTISEE